MYFDFKNHLKLALGKTLNSLCSAHGVYYPDLFGFAFEKNIQFNLISRSLQKSSLSLEYNAYEVGLHDTYRIKPWETKSWKGKSTNVIFHIPSKFVINSISLLASKDEEGRIIEEGHIWLNSENSDQLFIRPLGAQCELWLWYNYERLDQFIKEQDLFVVDKIEK